MSKGALAAVGAPSLLEIPARRGRPTDRPAESVEEHYVGLCLFLRLENQHDPFLDLLGVAA